MKKLHLICNSHIDTIWQWEWAEGMSATLSTFQSAANLMEKHDYIFCHGESSIYETKAKKRVKLASMFSTRLEISMNGIRLKALLKRICWWSRIQSKM